MEEPAIRRERTQNIWASAVRKLPPLANAAQMEVAPEVGSDQIGGLAQAQEEVLTYACALTNPEVYAHWGTFPPTGLLLIGRPGVGKRLLARALATRADAAFLAVDVPQLVLEVVHRGAKVGELLEAWHKLVSELAPVTVFFEELEFSQAEAIGAHRPDLPVGPIMDFLLDLVDRAVPVEGSLVVGSTAHPDSLRPAFFHPGRFERVVEVSPNYPDDIVAALRIHAAQAEKRAGRSLFDAVDWVDVVRRLRDPSVGEWIRLIHAVLRRKARCEAAGEGAERIQTEDLVAEVDRYRRAAEHLPRSASGNYL